MIGISSYLLINFWYTRLQANKSAISALTVNRVGDMFLSLGLFRIFWVFGNIDYSTVFSLRPFINETAITIIGLLLIIGAIAKSANVPLHLWLPLRMEGPTPVSALIHAATLVTAGVYLILRSTPILEYRPTVLIVITWIGALTALFAATTGLFQNDMKKIIRFSTCSQLGYLFIAVGISQSNIALFHLVNHAFFKALLFLAAGAVIHAIADQQDIRRLGGLINFLPFTYTAIIIGSLSLIAFPFLTGIYSKDLIIETGAARYNFSGILVYWIGTISARFTRFYSYRLIILTFFSVPNRSKNDYLNSHESPIIIVIPLVILSIFSIVFGYIAKDAFIGIGSDILSTALFIHPNHNILIEAEFSLNTIMKLLPVILSIIGALIAIIVYTLYPKITIIITNNQLGQKIYRFFNGKWLFDNIINGFIITDGLKIGQTISKVIDRGIIEILGPFGLSNIRYNTGNNIENYNTGIITTYALYIILGLIIIFLILLAPILGFSIGLNISLVLIYLITLLVIPKK